MLTTCLPAVSHCIPCTGGKYPPSPPEVLCCGGNEYSSPGHTHPQTYPPTHARNIFTPWTYPPQWTWYQRYPPSRKDMGPEIPIHPPHTGQTESRENITFLQLRWRAVAIYLYAPPHLISCLMYRGGWAVADPAREFGKIGGAKEFFQSKISMSWSEIAQAKK